MIEGDYLDVKSLTYLLEYSTIFGTLAIEICVHYCDLSLTSIKKYPFSSLTKRKYSKLPYDFLS